MGNSTEKFTNTILDLAQLMVEATSKSGRKDLEFRTTVEFDGKWNSIVVETQRISKEKAERIDKGFEELKIIRRKENISGVVDVLETDDGKVKQKNNPNSHQAIQTIRENKDDFDSTARAIMGMITRTYKKKRPHISLGWYIETLHDMVEMDVYPPTGMSELLFLEMHTEMCKQTQKMYGGVMATDGDMRDWSEFKKNIKL